MEARQRLTFTVPAADASWAEKARESGEPLPMLLPAKARGYGFVTDTCVDVDSARVNVTMDILT